MDVYYIDGEFIPADQAVISVNDLAVVRGYGVFDFLRTYGGAPFFLDAHIERLKHSAQCIGLDFPWSCKQVADIVMKTLAQNHHAEANIRIIVTGGDSDDFITPQGNSHLLVFVSRLIPSPPWWYLKGVKAITVPFERDIPDAKSINYLVAVVALRKARQQGAVEAIYVDRNQRVLEGTTTNVFAVTGNRLITPGDQILEGITRHVVLKMIAGIIDSEIRDVSLDEFRKADEIFITASNKEVVPVVQLDDVVIGDGKPGVFTGRIMEMFRIFSKQPIL